MSEQAKCYMSFGGGVQSTALAFLAMEKDPRLLDVCEGLLPEIYLFADTGDERSKTYAHVWEMAKLFEHHGLHLEIVRRGEDSLSEHVLSRAHAGEGGISMPPVFVDTQDGGSAPVRRGCTQDFKVRPLDRRAKLHFKPAIKAKIPVVQWYGISKDEATRMRDSRDKWRTFFYPLIWMGWTRWHCEQYLSKKVYLDGTPVMVVRSSCVFCPFHDREEWRSVKSEPLEWQKALDFEAGLESAHYEHGGVAGLKSLPSLARTGQRLRDMDLSEDDSQIDMWDNECAGVCGI